MIRFFHIRAEDLDGRILPKGGATVRVEGPMHGSLDERMLIRVQVTQCSPNDMFCRKTGRELAAKNQDVHVPLAHLPDLLHHTACKVLKRMKGTGIRAHHPLYRRDYSFSTKYFIERQTIGDGFVT